MLILYMQKKSRGIKLRDLAGGKYWNRTNSKPLIFQHLQGVMLTIRVNFLIEVRVAQLVSFLSGVREGVRVYGLHDVRSGPSALVLNYLFGYAEFV